MSQSSKWGVNHLNTAHANFSKHFNSIATNEIRFLFQRVQNISYLISYLSSPVFTATLSNNFLVLYFGCPGVACCTKRLCYV